ncbi:MAG: recombinase family protein [Bacteriovoracaceae bacterium]
MKRACLYIRCSTNHHEQKPELQADELRAYCKARGWQIAGEIIDHGFSGSSTKRPGLKRLQQLTSSRKVDIVVVVKLDRLFRSMKDLLITIQEYSDLGIDLVSIRDQVDLTTASGRLMVHILGAFAEFEKDLIRERTMAGLDHARAKGKILGRPTEYDGEKIRKLYREGMSLRAIQREIGCSLGVVYRAIEGDPKSPQASGLNQKVETLDLQVETKV